MTPSLLSLCCGAHPASTLRHHHAGQVSGWCTACGEWGLFAPRGVLETQPRFLRLPPLRAVGEAKPMIVEDAQGNWVSKKTGKVLIPREPLNLERPSAPGHALSPLDEAYKRMQPDNPPSYPYTDYCDPLPDEWHGRCADPQAERERQLRAIERRHAWRDILGILVAGWGWLLVMLACLVATGVWGACREPKGGQRGSQGGGEVLGDGAGLRVAHTRSVTAEVTQ